MEREIYISDGRLALCAYVPEEDAVDCYRCWQDEETQKGYNFVLSATFEQYAKQPPRSRFCATIFRCRDQRPIESLFLSPENTLPDLAIMLYPPFRGLGYGSAAFSLGVRCCFDVLKLDRVYAGCYQGNGRSMKMLRACGFRPHPEGNLIEKHYLNGGDIVQLDFVKYAPGRGPGLAAGKPADEPH